MSVARILFHWCAGLVFACTFSLPVLAAPSENVVKAAFLYNFFKFTDWPAAMTGPNQSVYQLCFAGNAESYAEALAALDGREVAGKPLSIRRDVRGEALKNCHMVFVAESDGGEALREVYGLPVVTVSDMAGFIHQGGMIGLVKNGQRLGFEVNLEAANVSNIHFSSQLLKLAKSVKGAK